MMSFLDHEYGLLVKRCRTGCIGELTHRKLESNSSDWWHSYMTGVRWLTGPQEGNITTENYEHLEMLSPEEEAMYRLAHLGSD